MRTMLAAAAASAAFLVPEASALNGEQGANARVIRAVFGAYGEQAVQVALCESGLSVWARNGQYLGAFQMGYYARGRYGHGSSIWTQARAAYRYFRDSGYRWSPWACRPA